ncbi:hypothetical protein BKA70DRAFT_821905 [Coprinopsis sp. MPI-PUGE-AT-0042]|nr:hypothetical protein BKA70DRAFT_821905 [Coprinopsis sp. MPI-PUGE-AT-0042]
MPLPLAMSPLSPTPKPIGLIAIMGATGSGKSSFTNAIIGEQVASVGGGLESLTAEVCQYPHRHSSGVDVRIMDTPGFNDFRLDGPKSDLKILQSIAGHFKAHHDANQKFSGIIFLHNINGAPIDWQTQRRNVTLFKKLCGAESMKNVVVVTTFWDQLLSITEGAEKERALQTEAGVLKDLWDAGAKFVRSGHFEADRHPGGEEFWTCQQIVDHLLSLDPVFIQMQKELADGKAVSDTSAGSDILQEFRILKRDTLESLKNMAVHLDTIKSASEESKSHQDELMVETRRLNRKIDGYEREASHWEDYRKEIATKDQIEALLARERETFTSLSIEISLLRALNEKQQGLLHESIRELTASLQDARKDKDVHLSQSEKLRLDLAEALRASDSERAWFEKELDRAHSTLEKTQNELREARSLHDQETRQNQDLHLRVQTLQKALDEATAERKRSRSETNPDVKRGSPGGKEAPGELGLPLKQGVRQRFKVSSLQAFPLTPPADDYKGYPLAPKALPKSQVPSPSHRAVPTIALPIPSRPTSTVPPSTLPFPALPQPASPVVHTRLASSPREPTARSRAKSILPSPRRSFKPSVSKLNSPSRVEALDAAKAKAKASPGRWQY